MARSPTSSYIAAKLALVQELTRQARIKSTMDWSIGQDDEAAESVRPRVSGSGAPGESTVVVDPVSQIPDPIPRFRREPVEKTEVLKGRRVDELRAEVQRKRKAQQREQHKRLALWGAAGAGAVILGALLAGLVFSSPSEPAQGANLNGSEYLTASESSEVNVASPAREETMSPVTQPQRAVAMEETPELVENAPSESAPSESAPSEAGASDPSSEGLSLDDLPSE